MPSQISVGPPVLTLNRGSAVMVTDLGGEIDSVSELGVFVKDTRFVSRYTIQANGYSWRRLTSGTANYYSSRVYLTNPRFTTVSGDVPDHTLALTISRSVGDGIHEDLDVTNHGLTPVLFRLELVLESDFADLFEVKSHTFVHRGQVVTEWDRERAELRTTYTRGDFRRRLIYRVVECQARPQYANGRITFEIALPPGGSWHACCHYIFGLGDQAIAPSGNCHQTGSETERDRQQREWVERTTTLESSHNDALRLFSQSVEDMGALRLSDQEASSTEWMPAAGVPWFVTIFGRDSLIVSLQNMIVHPGFARATLKTLARLQATVEDDWRDAEPGKIPHEIRFGELAHFKEIPHTPYYGTADATPLYLITLHEAWKWLGDDDLLRSYRDVALRCLDWIDQYGDRDGDGLQEYQTRSTKGYENQGWKDAGDAIVYPDGSQVASPKALCELQGYVFDAWVRMAEVFTALGEPERAAGLRRKATDLQALFEDRFWCEDSGFYAFALDARKQPVRTIASNAGHLLWSGIVRPDRAARVAERLLQPDMWTGWGIRTLSARNPAYNPLSYQLGSVWPHDNGIIALGCKRYGLTDAVGRIARDIIAAASHFVGYRLPELYAGLQRGPDTFPVLYPDANVPQAWAAGAVFHLLQAILGLQADAPAGALYVDPDLPEWLPDLTLRHLSVGRSTLDLRFWREGGRTRWDATVRQGRLAVIERAWQPPT